MCDKSRESSVQSHDIGTLTRYCILTRMPSHISVTLRCFWWRRNAVTSCQTLSRALVEFTFFVIKTAFKRLETPGNEINIYSYIIKGLLHWYWGILSLVGISKDARGTIFTNISAITLYYHSLGNSKRRKIDYVFLIVFLENRVWYFMQFACKIKS